jgi:hypothetical protein
MADRIPHDYDSITISELYELLFYAHIWGMTTVLECLVDLPSNHMIYDKQLAMMERSREGANQVL